MRIAIDARKLHDFGIGTYIRNLIRYLARIDTESDYQVLCRPQDRDQISAMGSNVRPIVERAAPYSIAEQVLIPAALWRHRPQLFHEPHYVLPPLVPCRSVVTIHDCIHLRFPQYLPNKAAYAYAYAAIWAATRRASRILTVSEASKRDILHFFNLPESKIVVIPNAFDERFALEPPEDEVHRVRERFQLNDRYVLYAGNIKPHKNVERLIEAFALVRRGPVGDLKLLIIGDAITTHASLRRAVHRHQLHKYVRFLGFVPDQTLAILYRLASVFVFPSLYEGFGLPPLEAMASGTPVVTSNVSSLPEVVGNAAVLIDPHDAGSIADGIRRVLVDERLRSELIARGFERARQYSWERSIGRIHEIYKEVLQ